MYRDCAVVYVGPMLDYTTHECEHVYAEVVFVISKFAIGLAGAYCCEQSPVVEHDDSDYRRRQD